MGGQFSRYLACTQVGYGQGSAGLCPDRRSARLEASRSDFALSRQTSGPGGRGGQIGSRGGARTFPYNSDFTTRREGSLHDYHEAVTAIHQAAFTQCPFQVEKTPLSMHPGSMKSRSKIGACFMKRHPKSPLSHSSHCPHCGSSRQSEQFERLEELSDPARLEVSQSFFALLRCALRPGGRGGRIESRGGGGTLPWTGHRTVGAEGSQSDWFTAVTAR